jgi:hypothetical protein
VARAFLLLKRIGVLGLYEAENPIGDIVSTKAIFARSRKGGEGVHIVALFAADLIRWQGDVV